MDRTFFDNFMQDLKIEAVKLNLQLACPHDRYQNNDVLGTLTANELNSMAAMAVIRTAISNLEACTDLVDLYELYCDWDILRLGIQYAGYGYDPKEKAIRKGEAYAYVFLMRVLKKRHKKLYAYMKML